MLPQVSESLTVGCCQGGEPHLHTRARRGWDVVAGAMSFGVWVCVPKCPLCLAAHVALWTGLGVSFTAATYLRWALLSASGGLLLYLIVRRISRLVAVR